MVIRRRVHTPNKNKKIKRNAAIKSKRVMKRSTSHPLIIRKSRTNRVVLGHGVAVRDSSRGRPMPHFLEDGSILNKRFGQAITKGEKIIAQS